MEYSQFEPRIENSINSTPITHNLKPAENVQIANGLVTDELKVKFNEEW